jgi:putative glutathione S-transferase
VSNDFRTIGIDLATQYGTWASGAPTYDPADVEEIEALDSWIGPTINQGVVAAGLGDTEARTALRESFERLDRRLARRRYLLGGRVTEADVRLWVTLVRFDVGANATRSIGAGLPEFPNLWAYARDLYSLPAFRGTTSFAAFTAPGAQPLDWSEPHGRDALEPAA